MTNIGLSELIVILLILVLVFGASRLPALGESVGKTIRGFKRGMAQDDRIDLAKLEKPKSDASKSQATARKPDEISEAEVIDETKR